MAPRCSRGAIFLSSCPGLTRASINLQKIHFSNWMDCRVKPGNDKRTFGFASDELFLPHPGMYVGGLILKQWPDDLDRSLSAAEHFAARQIERRIFRMVAGQLP